MQKVFRQEDLKKLAKLVAGAKVSGASPSGSETREYVVVTAQGVSLSTDNYGDLLGERVRDLPLRAVSFSYRAVNPDHSLRIEISEGDSRSSDIVIKGPSQAWASALQKQCEEILEGVAPQSGISVPLGILILIGVAALIGLPVASVIYQVVAYASGIEGRTPLFLQMICFAAAVSPAGFVVQALAGLWPSVEIQTGSEHQLKHKKRRRRLWSILSIVVIPVLVNVATDWLLRSEPTVPKQPTETLEASPADVQSALADLTEVKRDEVLKLRFRGRAVQWTMSLQDVRKMNGKVIATFLAGEKAPPLIVFATFESAEQALRAAEIKRGTSVIVKGVIKSATEASVSLEACRVP